MKVDSGVVMCGRFFLGTREEDIVEHYNVTPPEVPFGGYNQSVLGRENGLQAIEHYTQVKTIYANLGDVPQIY